MFDHNAFIKCTLGDFMFCFCIIWCLLVQGVRHLNRKEVSKWSKVFKYAPYGIIYDIQLNILRDYICLSRLLVIK